MKDVLAPLYAALLVKLHAKAQLSAHTDWSRSGTGKRNENIVVVVSFFCVTCVTRVTRVTCVKAKVLLSSIEHAVF